MSRDGQADMETIRQLEALCLGKLQECNSSPLMRYASLQHDLHGRDASGEEGTKGATAFPSHRLAGSENS